jgi:hypothetical protein
MHIQNKTEVKMNNLIKNKLIFYSISLLCYLFNSVATADYLITIPEATLNKTSVYWYGHVDSIISFKEGAIPDGISQGSLIAGSFKYDPFDFFSKGSIRGTYDAGTIYRYNETLNQTINIGESTWIINGASLSLTDGISYDDYFFNSFSSNQKAGIYSNSDLNSFEKFPNYAGNFEYSLEFADRTYPFSLFNSYPENPYFSLAEITGAGGFLSSRQWDYQRNITSGYYISFNIDKVSSSPIPLPPALIMFLSGFIVLSMQNWSISLNKATSSIG